jgi:hypothetical protein
MEPSIGRKYRPIMETVSGDIKLPENIKEKYTMCQEDPSVFWKTDQKNFDLSRSGPLLGNIYDGIRATETNLEWDVTIYRYFMLLFHDLANLFQINTQSGFGAKRLVGILSNATESDDTPETIKDHVHRWIRNGSRYGILATTLGTGALFLLPRSVSCKM